MRRAGFIFAFLCVLFPQTMSAQPDSLYNKAGEFNVNVAISGSGATNNALRPMWSYSQEWGRNTQYNQWEGNIYAKVAYSWHNRKNWFSINVGAALQASTDKNLTMLHEAYVSGKIWEIGYSIGREAYTPIDQRSGLGLGTYLMSDNARPYTRAGVGFFDWWAIPGIKNWIEIKGAVYLGMMPYEENGKDTKDALISEKFAYLRIGHFPVKPYLGLVHSVIMGGTLADGRKIPIDFWASFFGLGSDKMRQAGFEGEYYNAAGGHQGMWDLGLDFEFEPLDASLYYQRPFYDCTAMNLFQFGYCKDFTLGAYVRLKKFRPVSEISLEWCNMEWQGGKGIADPRFVSTGPEKTGDVIYLCQKEVNAGVIRKYVSAEWIANWESKNGKLTDANSYQCITDVVFEGHEGWTWGNRTPYFENAYYPQGWTVNGLAMGYPIMLTSKTMNAALQGQGYEFNRLFANVRLTAVNLGLKGWIIPSLDYKFKFTWSKNLGTWNDQYYNGIDFWKEKPNYYFSQPRNEFYSGLWLNWHWKAFTFSTALNYDFGDIYSSFSARLGVALSLNAIPGKK